MSAIDAIGITSIVVAAIVTAPSYAGPPTMASNKADERGTAGISGRDSAQQTSSSFRGALRFKPYNLQQTDVLSSDVIGLEVCNLSNQRVGLVDDIILGSNQIVKGVVINVGGFLGVGNRDIAVAARSVLILKRGDKLNRALIDVTSETLRTMDAFEFPASNRDRPPVSATPSRTSGKP